MEKVISSLKNRYAVKTFDKTKKLSDEQIAFIKEVLQLTPSSSGIQPWKFVFVTDTDTRAKLAGAAWNQPQITDSSLLIVFCARMDLTEVGANQVNKTKEVRGLEDAQVEGYKNMVMGQIDGMTSEEAVYKFGAEQCNIALGNLITSLAVAGIDACPMGGFSREEFDKVLDLNEKDLRSVVVCSVGVADENDYARKNKKVRFELSEIIEEI